MEDDTSNSNNSDADIVGAMLQRPPLGGASTTTISTGGAPNQPLDLGSSATNAFVYRSASSSTPIASSYFPFYKRHSNSSPRKLLIDLNPRFITKQLTATASRSHYHHTSKYRHYCPTSSSSSSSSSGGQDHRPMLSANGPHRMRPYYVPERSRTKSENALDAAGSASGSQLSPPSYPELLGGAGIAFDNDEDGDADADDLEPSRHHQQPLFNLHLHQHHQMDTCSTISSGGPAEVAATLVFGGGLPQQQHQSLQQSAAVDRSAMPAAATSLASTGAIKKSRSLEDICRGVRSLEAGSQASHEMEFMSSRIQKLKVQD